MMEWVLDNHYGEQLRDERYVEYVIDTHDAREHDLLELMESFVERFPDIHFASMPHELSHKTDLEFGVRGQENKVRVAMEWLTGELNARGFRWEARRHMLSNTPSRWFCRFLQADPVYKDVPQLSTHLLHLKSVA